MTQKQDIAAALGKKLWSTDSFIPEYRWGEIGPWRINPGGQLVNDWGYYSGPCLLEMLPSLSRKVVTKGDINSDLWETWMALTPQEIESQELGYLHASKEVVIMGLGMGWIAANSAMNPRVTQVTVVEHDPDVIKLFYESGAFESIPTSARRKVSIVNADALEWHSRAAQTVNFLYADIWLHLAEAGTLGQVRQMQDNVHAEKIYFWGQELTIYSAMMRNSGSNVAITAEAIDRAVTDVIDLPLLLPDDRDYAWMIEQVIRNRIDRRLPIDAEIR